VATTSEILQRTFLHAPGVGQKTEKSLWENGITSWTKFLNCSSVSFKSLRTRPQVFQIIEQSAKALDERNIRFFSEWVPREEWWRLPGSFQSKVVFLDIETTGLSHYYDEITLVGLYDGQEVETLLSGHNLKRLPDVLARYDIVVTFNGTLFDLPFLKTKLPNLRLPPVHLDLRYLLKRVGYSGGLKEVERRLRIRRSKAAQAVDGYIATVLWSRYKRGDISALEQLVQYNVADVTNLKNLMQLACQRLAERLLNSGKENRVSQLLTVKSITVPVRVNRANESGVRLVVGKREILLRNRKVERPPIALKDLLGAIKKNSGEIPTVVGIDLRASELRPTGWSILEGDFAYTRLLKTDEQIISETVRYDPDIISIDSPLGIPVGRCCMEDSCLCRAKGILRECERILWKRGVKVFPCLLPSMQKLTERGIRLAEEFRRRGYVVIESYPGAAQDIMRIPRKRSSLAELAQGLANFGIRGRFVFEPCTHDELDAITSAVVGHFFLAGAYEGLGDKREEQLIVPKVTVAH
jgi:uncharacterized protein YprB with RNaseH-like and TPR domain/predicted nuclease with RNAse H fold